MLANELIDRLEQRGLLDQEIIEALREQLAQTGGRVKPEAVAKLLVDNGQLTRYQATELIGEIRSAGDDPFSEEVTEVEEDLTAIGDVAEVVEEEIEIVEAEPVMAMPMEEAVPVQETNDLAAGMPVDSDARPKPRSSSRVKRPEEKSTWDSFKIYGYLGIIGFLVLSAVGLWFILSKGNADEMIDNANTLYNTQSYQPAQDAYLAFLDMFGESSQYSSLARTRITMSELYRGEAMRDPTAALDMAKEKLPGLIEEEGLNEERGNLAALLVDIADNIANAASEATETTEKQRLLDRLDEQQTLIDNPNYMLSSMKKTLSAQLTAITETRNRVQRDIQRNIRLDETEAAMTKALSSKDTKEAYDLRQTLLRDFPELRSDPRLAKLIQEASGIQETLVSVSTNLPDMSTEPVDTGDLRSIVLTSLRGEPIPGLQGENYFLRAGGSVLAFAVHDGRLLWRKFTGFGQDHTPLRIDGGASVLLSNLDDNEVQHFRGDDGELLWRTEIEEPFAEPVAGRNMILVTAASGRILSLDTDSGDANWATQLPQTATVAPGLDEKLGKLYLPGDHSNLYVLGARDGKCVESFYVGHAEGTIAVPPVSLLGHVFVVENAGSDYAQVHVLKVDDQGQNLEPAQLPFRLTGNVIVPPVIQNRRVIFLTDRGQVAVYDIEPTADRDQVSLIAQQAASYDAPTMTRMAVGRAQMWITGTRIGRFELQINTGRVVYDWGKHEGDTFIGQPLALEDVLVHARVLRGTSSIRVTAAEPKTGTTLWSTDVGTPVSMITPSPSGGFHAVTSQAAMFALDAESLKSGSTKSPIENPGETGIAMRFEDPVRIDETRRVLLNEATKGQALIYDPSRRSEKLRKVTLQLTQAKPAGHSLIAGGGLLVPLDSGRIVLMNWQTGASLGSPFQPPSDPTDRVTWTQPVLVDDDADQVVIGDSRSNLFRLRIGEQIRQLASVQLDQPLLGPALAMGGMYVATTAGPSADTLIGFQQGDLSTSFNTLVNGRVLWGPVRADGPSGGPADATALLITDDQTLRAYDSSGTQKFEVSLATLGPRPGVPLDRVVTVGTRWLITGRDGWLMVLDSETGEVVGVDHLNQPLSAEPLVVGSRLLVPGSEGVIYITSIPSDA
ncbi:MAG: PQQ-binding-like beta-propeller repeat protein [Planctomycetota bacterium]